MSGRHSKKRMTGEIIGAVLVLALMGVAAFALYQRIAGSPEVCRYTSVKVTVEITGPDCYPIMRMVADDADNAHIWVSTDKSRGEQFSQLQKGPDTVRIYEAGNKKFAGVLSDFFQARKWSAEPLS